MIVLVDLLVKEIDYCFFVWYSTGHAFALGAILALAHDYRVMRTKRGWFCLPEVKYNMLFGKGLISLLR